MNTPALWCYPFCGHILGIFKKQNKNNHFLKWLSVYTVWTRHHCSGKFSLLNKLLTACYHYMQCYKLSTAEIKWDPGTLFTECSNYWRLISACFLQQQTLQPTPPPTAQLSDEANSFMIESESEFLDAAKKFFSEQKANFEDERQKFTEAAIRLGREVTVSLCKTYSAICSGMIRCSCLLIRVLITLSQSCNKYI